MSSKPHRQIASDSPSQVCAPPDLLGDFAHRTLKKHFKKTLKQKASVLQDTDPEPLHQMRVGIRRLRTALSIFSAGVKLPNSVTDRQLSKLAKRLGNVRDLDVLMMWLQTYRQTAADLSQAEQATLANVEKYLKQKRQRSFTQMRKYFKSRDYKSLVTGFKGWLASPDYGPLAPVPLTLVLPDLLLPLISEVFQHPGWLVAVKTGENGRIRPLKRMGLARIDHCLAIQGPLLHDLRKRIKQVRYQSEFFLGRYDLAYASQFKDFRQLQDTLGVLQDEAIISEVLAKILGKDWSTQLPSLTQLFEQERRQAWRQWQTLQAEYLEPRVRQGLRQQVNHPRQT